MLLPVTSGNRSVKRGEFYFDAVEKNTPHISFLWKNLIGIISFEKFLRLETCLWLTRYHPLFLKKIGFFASCSSPWNSTIDPTVTTFFDWSLFEIRGCSGRNISYYKYVKVNFSKDSIMASVICYVLINKNVLIYKNICSYYKNML